MNKAFKDKRSQKRIRIAMPVSSTYYYQKNESNKKNTYNCTILDVSKDGMCIYSERLLRKGNSIVVQWVVPRAGLVMWCQEVTSHLYRAGILFE